MAFTQLRQCRIALPLPVGLSAASRRLVDECLQGQRPAQQQIVITSLVRGQLQHLLRLAAIQQQVTIRTTRVAIVGVQVQGRLKILAGPRVVAAVR